MILLIELGAVLALVGGGLFYVLSLFAASRDRAARERDTLQQRVEEQDAQIQAMEARLRYLEAALCQGNAGGSPTLSLPPPGNHDAARSAGPVRNG